MYTELTALPPGQNCSLRMVGDGFTNIGYGLGLPKSSLYTEELTIQIYLLRESGFTDSLEDKWWVSTSSFNIRKTLCLD